MHGALTIEELLKPQNEENNVQGPSLFFYTQGKPMTVHFNICIHWDASTTYGRIPNLSYARLCCVAQGRLHAWARDRDRVSPLLHLSQILIHKIKPLWPKVVSEPVSQVRIARTARWKWSGRELGLLWFDVNIAVLIGLQRKPYQSFLGTAMRGSLPKHETSGLIKTSSFTPGYSHAKCRGSASRVLSPTGMESDERGREEK